MKKIACIVALLLSFPAKADNAVLDTALRPFLGTLETLSEPVYQDGQLMGCSIVYNVLMRDYVYR